MINTVLKNTITQTLLRDKLMRKADFHVGVRSSKKVVPNLNISFDAASGSEKYFLNLNRRGVTVGAEKHTYLVDKLRLKVGNNTDIWHVDANGDFKWDVEYAVDPRPRKGIPHIERWDLSHSAGIQFFYQDTLENDWAKNGIGMTLAEYLATNTRPAKVVGSYAVYGDKKHHVVRPDGSTIVNYATGKLAHIYRPLCIDAAGNKVWGVLNIKGGTLSIKIPASYLDNAVYPVTLDPTIGNTAGGATGGTAIGTIWATQFNAPVSGDANPGTMYITSAGRNYPPTKNVIGAVYADDGSGSVSGQAKLSGDSGIASFADYKNTLNAAITWTGIVAGTNYWLAVNYEENNYYYDISSVPTEAYGLTYTGAMPAIFGTATSYPRTLSTYITYTAGGGGSTNILPMIYYQRQREGFI